MKPKSQSCVYIYTWFMPLVEKQDQRMHGMAVLDSDG